MTPIPWRDQAALIRTSGASIHDGGRVIVAEGPLHQLLDMADALAPELLAWHYITLPDRRTAPFRYEGDAIRSLLGRIDRPGAFKPPQTRQAAAR